MDLASEGSKKGGFKVNPAKMEHIRSRSTVPADRGKILRLVKGKNLEKRDSYKGVTDSLVRDFSG